MGESTHEKGEGVPVARWHVSLSLRMVFVSRLLTLRSRMVAIACLVLTAFHPAFFFEPFSAFRHAQRKSSQREASPPLSD